MSGNRSSGRKSKSDELAMIERLSPLDDEAFSELEKGIKRGEFAFIKLYMLYRFGKPKQIQEITINSEQPLFNLSEIQQIL
tara:strand:+ start:290 stop:532 length:243 start_codon:yes stop_codon:yes gene_type:complete